MSKMTLLEIVQNILNAMDSDEVNSIGDTVESMQVAEIVKETYNYITIGIEIPGRHGIIKLDASTDIDKPVTMRAPENAEHIEWIRYNGKEVSYLAPETFVQHVSMFADEDTITYDDLRAKTNADPRYYTSFDDDYIVFDSYDASVDDTLQQSKTLCWGQKVANFLMEDTFVPALPLDMFPRLLAEAKSTCFINYKQVANAKEEKRSRDQLVRGQNNRYKNGTVRPQDRLPNYGRRR